MQEVISEPDILIMNPGSRFLVEDIAREGCDDDMENIECFKQIGPEELVAEARGKFKIQILNTISRVSNRVQSICTHYSCFENQCLFLTLKKNRTPSFLRKAGCKKLRSLLF